MIVESVPATGKNQAQSIETSLPLEHPPPSYKNEEKPVESTPDLSQMREISENFQQDLKMFHHVDLKFDVHQASGQIMVTVTDEDTGKVIREIPSSEMLNLSTKLQEMIGIIFDQKI